MEKSKVGIEKFDGSDFGFWKMQIEDYLYQKDLHEPLTGVKPDSMTEEQWKLKDRQALGMIWLTLTKNVAFNIVKENTTAGLLKALSNMYEKPSAMNKALILLSSMPESWDTVVAAISSSRGSEKLKFDEIHDVVLSESIRKREMGDSSGSALSVDRRGRSKFKGQHQHGRSKSKNRGKSPNRSNITCWNCGDKGHFKADCKKPKKKQNQKSGDDGDSVNSAEDIGDALILSVDSPVESWILDSGASFHSSPSKEFQNFKSGNFGKVYLADNKALVIEGKGDVSIKTPAGNQWTLKDVRYIPGLKKNLISIGQLDNKGYAAEFGKGSWKIVKGAMVVARGTKFGTLYTTAGFWDDKNRKILRHCDVTFDESVLYKDKDREQKVPETTKQVGVEVELEKSTPINVEAETQPTPHTVVEEPKVEQVTPEQVLRRSSRISRVPDRETRDKFSVIVSA
ncbi:unnamed protein product [Cuscuta campestris]|uniref:CCHC-type domain-containing protein n=1 Tax=Cuscuta campestris TaxID=132261 RepID=A0A484KC47_9ASTE|nr:unnamed protein product [Cuscuta campestris]